MTTANESLIKNLENQLERVVNQLKDLEEFKNELSAEEYDSMKEETVEQIHEFSETLERMQKGDITLKSRLTSMKEAIRKAISEAFNTVEMIKTFGAQNINEIEQQLVNLEQEYHLKKISNDEYQIKKIKLLTQLQAEGRTISTKDKEFLEQTNEEFLNKMEAVTEDN